MRAAGRSPRMHSIWLATSSRESGASSTRGSEDLREVILVDGARQPPQRGDDRRERDLAFAQLDALTDERPCPSSLGPCRELGDEPALAHARIAADEDDPGLAGGGLLERMLEVGELAGATHQVWAGDAGRHEPIIYGLEQRSSVPRWPACGPGASRGGSSGGSAAGGASAPRRRAQRGRPGDAGGRCAPG